MEHKKGMITLFILLFLSSLATAAAAATVYITGYARAVSAYSHGLRAVYAAESGAVWALGYLSLYGKKPESGTVSVDMEDGLSFSVTCHDGSSSNIEGVNMVINSAGKEGKTDIKRYVWLYSKMEIKEKGADVTVLRTGTKRK